MERDEGNQEDEKYIFHVLMIGLNCKKGSALFILVAR